MGDRVAVMRKGELQQVDDPQTLYDRPVNIFVGGFIGSPAMNMLDATIESNGGLSAKIGKQTIALGAETLEHRPALQGYAGKPVIIGIRPEDLEDAALVTDAPANQRLVGRLELREALGSEIMAHFAIEAAHAETDEMREIAEDSAPPSPAPESASSRTKRSSSAGSVLDHGSKQGAEVTAVVDTRALHFFDPATGAGIYDASPTRKGDTS